MKQAPISLPPTLPPLSVMAVECIGYDDNEQVISKSRTLLIDIVRSMTVSLPIVRHGVQRA